MLTGAPGRRRTERGGGPGRIRPPEHRRLIRLTPLYLLLASGGGYVAGQQTAAPGTADAPTFRARSDLVVVDVGVFDRQSRPVANLSAGAFTIREDGRAQRIAFFTRQEVPVAAGLVIDNSTSMLTRRRLIAAGVHAFAQSQRADDEAFTVVFNEHVRFGLPAPVPFTHSPALLLSTLARFPAGGRTALHDAVTAALDHLERAVNPKRLLLVLSDGDDNASRLSERDMLQRAGRSTALVFTVSTARLTGGGGDERVLRTLARATGGRAFSPRDEAGVVDAFERIGEAARLGYRIGYEPSNAVRDGSYRRLDVQVHAPGRTPLVLQVRSGYVAPRDGNPE